MENTEYFFFTIEEKRRFIEEEADILVGKGEIPISSTVYIGVSLEHIDVKERILNILKSDGLSFTIETYKDDTYYNIGTTFPEITKGEKLMDFIEENFPETSVEMEIMEECAERFKCPVCGVMYKDLDEALTCHVEDCREQLIERNEEFNRYLKEDK